MGVGKETGVRSKWYETNYNLRTYPNESDGDYFIIAWRERERERERVEAFAFSLFPILTGVGLISSGGGGSCGGGIARVLADIAHTAQTRLVVPLLSSYPSLVLQLLVLFPVHECTVLLSSLSPLYASLSLTP